MFWFYKEEGGVYTAVPYIFSQNGDVNYLSVKLIDQTIAM